MRVTTSKSKNSESFYITKSYTNTQGKSTSTTIKKLGTLAELSERLGTDRDGVMAWAKEQARIETEKFQMLKKALKTPCTTEQLLHVLRSMRFADIEEQGFIPVYERQRIVALIFLFNCQRWDYSF